MAVTVNGWGAVNVAEVGVVNKCIEKQKKLPAGFTVTIEEEIEKIIQITCTISGSEDSDAAACLWDKWEIIPGGSGSIIKLACTAGEAWAWLGINGNLVKHNISHSSIHLSLNLKAVADAAYNIKGQSGNAHTIVVDDEGDVQIEDTSDIKGLDKDKDILVINVIKDGFKKYFTEHLREFNGVFGVIMIGGKLAKDKQQFQWLMPTNVSYAVEQAYNGKNYFGILTMLDNDQITSQSQQIDVRAFDRMPAGANSVLMISAEKFCRHFLLPSAVSIIKNSKAEDFNIGTDGVSITNNKELVWDDFELESGKTISPVIPMGAFDIRVKANSIHIEINGMHHSPSAGIDMYMDMAQDIRIKMEHRTDGGIVIVPDKNSPFNENNVTASVKVAEWLKITELIMDIITIASSLSFGAGKLKEKIEAKMLSRVVSESVAEITAAAEEIAEAAAEEEEEVAQSVAVAAEEIASGAAKTTGFFSANYCHVFYNICGIMAAAGGIVVGITELVKWIEQKDYDKLPALDQFAETLLGNYAWPNLDDAKIVDGELDDVLLIYTNVPAGN